MFPYPQVLVDIPSIFHSVEFDGPFQKCQICSRELLHDAQTYMIEKVFRGPEAIIEIATCLPCSIEMQSEISAESMATIQKEFYGKINIVERLDWLGVQSGTGLTGEELDEAEGTPAPEQETDLSGDPLIEADKWLDACILTGAARETTPNFQVVGMFVGNQMVLSVFPYFISSNAIEEIGEKLSQETRGYMQDFIDDKFGMPPEFCNPESPLPLLI